MLLGGIFGLMCFRVKQGQLYLQGCIAEQTGKLCFRINFRRH